MQVSTMVCNNDPDVKYPNRKFHLQNNRIMVSKSLPSPSVYKYIGWYADCLYAKPLSPIHVNENENALVKDRGRSLTRQCVVVYDVGTIRADVAG